MKKSIIEVIKQNKGTIIKGALIGAGSMLSLAIGKAMIGADINEELEVDENVELEPVDVEYSEVDTEEK